MERVIVWHRWSPTSEPSREAVSLGTSWRVAARDRFLAVEAYVLSELGGTVVFALEPAQLIRAVELCMSSVRDAEREDSGAGGVSCGIAIGNIELGADDSAYSGDALDRAQALAHLAEPSDVVLDAAAQSAASATFLFAREVSGAHGLLGAVLDRVFPRRSDCQRALSRLGRPPFPLNGQTQFESLRRLARSPGRHRVLLVGPHGIGIGQWLARLAEEMSAPLWLDVRALGASLAPLSGLAQALRRLPAAAAPEQVLTTQAEADRDAQAILVAIRAGRAVSRRDSIIALRHYIGRSSEGGHRPLISVDPAPLIDPSSVGVIAEAAREGGPDALIVMRMLLESKPPEAFARGGGLAEVRVRGLTLPEARTLAAGMLGSAGQEAPSDLARRAVTMGGGNPLAVATALRVLVASGDVVFDVPDVDPSASGARVGGFRWRRGPAGRLDAMSLEELLEERIDALAAPLRRVLEVLVTVPDPDDRELAGAVAQGDGLMEETWVRAVEELDVLGLLRLDSKLARPEAGIDSKLTRPEVGIDSKLARPEVGIDSRGIGVSPSLRQVVQTSMSPARTLELHGSVARALASRSSASEDDFERATLAYYLAHAGQMAEAAAMFLAVAARAGQLGFLRSGVRLAAAAVECDPSPGTRARAAQIAESLSERQSTPGRVSKSQPNPALVGSAAAAADPRNAGSGPKDFAAEAGGRAVQAILARDFDEVERALELLIAAGRDGAAVDRLRTVVLLVKGDPAAASTLVQKLCDAAAPTPSAKLTLTSALVSASRGDVSAAVRGCLETLARTRRASDALGERAALSVLSLCYRRLGRDAEAARLADAALAGPARAGAEYLNSLSR